MLFKLLIAAVMLVPQDARLADRIVAIVNDEPIMLSELYQNTFTDLSEQPGEEEVLQNRLESRINRTLILQEVRRLKIFTVTPAEIDRYKEQLLQQLGGDREIMLARFERAGVRPEEIDATIELIQLINEFIDYRFRRAIQIEEEDLREYYDNEFSADFSKRNPDAPVPQFETVQSLIQSLLIERHVNDSLEQWLTEARSRAQIVIRF